MGDKKIQGSIEEYIPNSSAPWNKARVKHLYNRIGSGCTVSELNAALLIEPSKLIDQLIDEAMDLPIPDYDVFPWTGHPEFLENDPYAHFDRTERIYQVKFHLTENLVNNPVKYKMVLFWSNHFVTENHPNLVHSAIPTYLYYRALCTYALGNFETFTEKMSLTPMMLMYLNGNSNTVGKPNENFARELLELFTLGDGNYEQKDIENIARAYTGWKAGSHNGYYVIDQFVFSHDEYILKKEDHDWTTVKLFDKTYTPKQPTNDKEAKDFAYEEFQWIVNTILTEKRDEVARFICGKLYKFYVYEEVDPLIVESMAEVFKQNWEIADVLRVLFKSEHFFDENAIGIQIKSSVELYVQYVRKVGYQQNKHWYSSAFALHPDFDPDHPYENGDLGITCHNHASWWAHQSVAQSILNPPNVAGWKGGRFWLTETNLLNRWSTFLPQALQLLGVDGWSSEEKMDRPLNRQYIADHLKELSNDSSDVNVIVRSIFDFHLSCPVSEDTIQIGISEFKQNIYPENYYSNGYWNLDEDRIWWQYGKLLQYIGRLPEFQLT